MDKSSLILRLIHLTNKRAGLIPATPSDFNELSMRIEARTGRTLSASTLKRLWGYSLYTSLPSTTTLNILCNYNGMRDWKSFALNEMGQGELSSEHLVTVFIRSADLRDGDIVEALWNPGKGCKLKYLGDERFRVLEAENIKLQPGDIIRVISFEIGAWFRAMELQRGPEVIGGYVGAKSGGITSLRRFKEN